MLVDGSDRRDVAAGAAFATIVAVAAIVAPACVFSNGLPGGAVVFCSTPNECPSGYTCIPAGRCSDDDDTRAPVVESGSVAPEEAGIGDSVVLSLRASEPLLRPPSVRLDDARDERFEVDSADADGRTFTFSWVVRGDEPEGVPVDILAQLVDEFGNESPELRAAVVSFDFTPPICGDGSTSGDEACDDGNAVDGDGCSIACQVEEGWTCGVDAACAPICGDGIVVGTEGCDDAELIAGDGCSAACALEAGFACAGQPSVCAATCGDGDVDVAAGEVCDDGGLIVDDGCNANCLVEAGFSCPPAGGACIATCGDGTVLGAETCDDANLAAADGCAADCRIEVGWTCTVDAPSVCNRCGDGIVFGTEACDDGDNGGGDGCGSDCAPEPGFVCGGSPSICANTCGDGEIDPGESCDDDDLAAGDGCTSSCALEQGFLCDGSGATSCGAICGDGLVRGNEGCDDGALVVGDGCGACVVEVGFFCTGEPSLCGLGCSIGGEAVAEGARDPANPCRACISAISENAYSALPDQTSCADATFCNGAERCIAAVCVPGPAPCAPTSSAPFCDEAASRCECDAASCDDEVFCNGAESCAPATGACTAGAPPSCTAPAALCSNAAAACVECEGDDDCAPQESCSGGACIVGGECSGGTARAFTDGDEDGIGVGLLGTDCLPLPPPVGFSDVSGDCDDANAAVFRSTTIFPDADGDTYTGAGITSCIGLLPPAGFLETAQPPPLTNFVPLTAVEVDGAGTEAWASPTSALVADFIGAESYFSAVSETLVVTGHGFAVPANATVRGVTARVRRAVFDDSNEGGFFNGSHDASVRLFLNGASIGAERARTAETWPSDTYDDASYGAANDLWGASLTPATVNDPDFGVGVAVDATSSVFTASSIDAIRIELFFSGASGIDCDDANPTTYLLADTLLDADQDGYTVGPPSPRCIGVDIPTGQRLTSAGEDCYDESALVYPSSFFSSTLQRGDGSFDYNCDGSETKLAEPSHSNCSCNPCFSSATAQVVPGAACGLSSNVQRCPSSGTSCGPCDPGSFSVATRCR